jgi:hypothetical protein
MMDNTVFPRSFCLIHCIVRSAEKLLPRIDLLCHRGDTHADCQRGRALNLLAQRGLDPKG